MYFLLQYNKLNSPRTAFCPLFLNIPMQLPSYRFPGQLQQQDLCLLNDSYYFNFVTLAS